MNEFDILEKIASNLTKQRGSAALSNYDVLCNNIAFLHKLFEIGVNKLESILNHLTQDVSNNSLLTNDFKENERLHSFISVIPSLLSSDLEIIKKLSNYTLPDNREGIVVENVSKLHRGFVDYNNLTTVTRQFIDSLVTNSYQLSLLDPKEFNYHVLLSLNSFEKYATKSIRQGLFNQEIEDALTEFRKLGFRDWKNSSITKCQQPSFSNKVDYLFSITNKTTPENELFKEDIKNIFKFTSEFTHIGYISTFFTSKPGAQVIFSGEVSPYLPSTENFSELKYQILETCISFIYEIYLPNLSSCISRIVSGQEEINLQNELSDLISFLKNEITTRNNKYYFFVRSSLIGSSETIPLPCLCGYLNKWIPPHNNTNLFCTGCGSAFNILSMAGNANYIPTSNGMIKVIGSKAPEFKDLPEEEQQEMLKTILNRLPVQE